MAKTLSVKDSSLTAVADSIRKKTGKSEKLTFPAEFVSEIEGITTGGGGRAPAVEVQPSDVNFLTMMEPSLPHIQRQRRKHLQNCQHRRNTTGWYFKAGTTPWRRL